MFGKLFGKKQEKQPAGENQEKLSGPKDILQPVGQSLVVAHKQEPDWAWSLKTVVRSFSNTPHHVEFRVYDPQEAMAIGLAVKNFHTLDQHPDLILYSGWLDKKTKDMELVDHRAASQQAV